jgi:cytochrome c-type biogenesis protein CcmH
MRALLAALLVMLALSPAAAVQPGEALADPALEARARAISANLRCLVCQNQSIDDSDAELARDLRLIVRERLTAGDTDSEATQYIVDRYGEFVLLNPVMAPHTLLLWIATPVVLVIGVVAVLLGIRRRRAVAVVVSDATLSAEEETALRELQSAPPPPSRGR